MCRHHDKKADLRQLSSDGNCARAAADWPLAKHINMKLGPPLAHLVCKSCWDAAAQ
jgi:hypothetical protein